MIHALEHIIETKYGPRTVTGYWAVEAKKGGDRLKAVIEEVEQALEDKAKKETPRPHAR